MNTTTAPIQFVSVFGCEGHITHIGPALDVGHWSDSHAGRGIEGNVDVTLRTACGCCDPDEWTDTYAFTSWDGEQAEITVGRTTIVFPL